jgi:IS30 family transposase
MPKSQLTMGERCVITHMHAAGHAPAAIARRLDRHRGTVGRELARNADALGGYHYHDAQHQAEHRRTRASRP